MQAQETNANTHVTNRQGQQLSAIARDLGITRREFQALKFFLENNLNPKPFFKKLKEQENWFVWLEAQARRHRVRVKVIYDLKVNYQMSFEESMARLSRPWNSHHKGALQQVKSYYDEEGTGIQVETFVLLSHIWGSRCYNSGDLFSMIEKEIAPKLSLRKAGPRAIFTIGAKIPKLSDYMGLNRVSIFETMGSPSQVRSIGYDSSCCVTFNEKIRPCIICQALVIENPNDEDGENWLVFRK